MADQRSWVLNIGEGTLTKSQCELHCLVVLGLGVADTDVAAVQAEVKEDKGSACVTRSLRGLIEATGLTSAR